MNKIILLSLLPFFCVENCLSTQLLQPDNDSFGLHFRGKMERSSEESFPLIVEDPVPESSPSRTQLTEEGVDEEALFSCLGEVWEAFKAQNFEGYFCKLKQLKEKNNPQACYLLGMMYEKGLGRMLAVSTDAVPYYSLAMAYADRESLLYEMALRGLERCKSKRLERVIYYRR